ncbi:hypothetical protein PIB30_068142 [Stylosanthes scabra]|uniref:GDSL esterase/lipase n=1 Tax=Stylosanthes scabra TaxID=79078 RepID=A0ABU6YNC4_9FABA|nr:hypothetical protein [Stylosanthes scabra]
MKKIKVEKDEEFIMLLEEDHIEQMIQELLHYGSSNQFEGFHLQRRRQRSKRLLAAAEVGRGGSEVGSEDCGTVTTAAHGNRTAVAHIGNNNNNNYNKKVPAIIVFGDSSVDSGNNNFIPTIARSNFEPYGRDFPDGNPTGRFSNGKIAPDFISEAFGLRPTVPAYLDPSYTISDFANGVCFASAGTGFDNATSNVAGVIPLWKEVEYYKDYQKKSRAHVGEVKANEILKEALYLVSIGTNDFLENYYTFPQRRCQFKQVQEYEDFLIGLAENFF